MTDQPSFLERLPLAIHDKRSGDVIFQVPQPASAAAMRTTVSYEGEELYLPHLGDEFIQWTDLRGADLRGLFMHRTVFAHVQLAGADFTGAHLHDTIFLNCRDLDQAIGLDRAEHDGPSVLDMTTLRACLPGLTEVFLTGTGLTADEVAALRGVAGGDR